MAEKKLLEAIVEAIEDKKGEDIVVLDISELEGTVCDAFVIATGASSVQVEAICSGVEDDVFKKLRDKVIRVDGLRNAQWVAMDYGDVMVHIFQSEERDFYALEELWADGKVVKF